LLDKAHDLVIVRHDDPIKISKPFQYDVAWPQVAERQFADDERMHQYLLATEQIRQHLVGAAQMIDPHRTVDQDHAGFDRRRRTGFRSG
jgi:hypothetical protein